MIAAMGHALYKAGTRDKLDLAGYPNFVVSEPRSGESNHGN